MVTKQILPDFVQLGDSQLMKCTPHLLSFNTLRSTLNIVGHTTDETLLQHLHEIQSKGIKFTEVTIVLNNHLEELSHFFLSLSMTPYTS